MVLETKFNIGDKVICKQEEIVADERCSECGKYTHKQITQILEGIITKFEVWHTGEEISIIYAVSIDDCDDIYVDEEKIELMCVK